MFQWNHSANVFAIFLCCMGSDAMYQNCFSRSGTKRRRSTEAKDRRAWRKRESRFLGHARKVEKREDKRARVYKNCNKLSPKLHLAGITYKNYWLNANSITPLLKVSTRGNFQIFYCIRWIVCIFRINFVLPDHFYKNTKTINIYRWFSYMYFNIFRKHS